MWELASHKREHGGLGQTILRMRCDLILAADLEVGPGDGFGCLKNGRAINLAHAEGLGV